MDALCVVGRRREHLPETLQRGLPLANGLTAELESGDGLIREERRDTDHINIAAFAVT